MGAFVCSDVVNSVFTGTTTLEVNSAVPVEGSNVRVSEVLELGEDEVGVTVSSDVINSVLTGTTTLEVNSAVPVEGSNVRVSEVHEHDLLSGQTAQIETKCDSSGSTSGGLFSTESRIT